MAPSTGLDHFHCLMVFGNKLDIKNRESLLIDGFGVNCRKIGSGKTAIQGCYEYCIKDGDFIEGGGWDFFIGSSNFLKRRADFV